MPITLKILTVSDLHRGRPLYFLLREAVEQHRPDVIAVVGDFLDAFGGRDQLTNEECALLLCKLPGKELVFVRGNHEDEAWLKFSAAWPHARRKLHALHGEAFVHGPLVIVGFPCLLGVEDAYVGTRLPLPVDPEAWLPGVIHPWGKAARTLWLMHEPPFGTPLSQRSGPIAGNFEWVVAIHRFSPWLTVSGHDHRSPMENNCWHCRIEQTMCVNVGQSDAGPLHYCVIEATFPQATPCLPQHIKVTAFPSNVTICLP